MYSTTRFIHQEKRAVGDFNRESPLNHSFLCRKIIFRPAFSSITVTGHG
jgi:hypothetical protein